jgi:protein-L-isoaspartate O-methyltransferase
MKYKNLLNSTLGVIIYLLMQNRHVWKLMDTKQQSTIKAVNQKVNIYREDYLNSEAYQNGMNWDRATIKNIDYRGWLKELGNYLHANAPKALLEIGPGSGYYSSYILNAGIEKYYGAEINPSFVEYLTPRINAYGQDHNISVTLFCGEIKTLPNINVDSIIILSALHHIPDRLEMFMMLDEKLSRNGSVMAIEPTHYLPRVIVLVWRIFRLYHKKAFWADQTNLSTHHFLTKAEYESIASKLNWRVDYDAYRFPIRVARFLKVLGVLRGSEDNNNFINSDSARRLKWLSIESVTVLKK